MAILPLWEDLQRAAREPGGQGLQLWAWLKDKLDLAMYRPQATAGVVARRLTGRDGVYHILKNPVAKTYYRLSERDFFLWQRMDGTQSVKDLVVAYFLEYGSFAFARVASLTEGLKSSYFLVDPPIDVYSQVRSGLQKRSWAYRVSQLWQAFLEKQFALNGLDGALGTIYRTAGWLFYTPLMLAFYLVVSVAGLYLFYQVFKTQGFGIVTIAGSVQWGIVGLIGAELASIFVHEMAHALTVKHYGREVRRGGFMLYFGMPAFFVDTMDIWLENKRARLAVTWAGPYSGLILGGLASITITLRPTSELSALLFQFAVVSYLTVFFNLNPLMELDGYFVLMDWLEIPMLRAKSLEFVRTGLWARLKEVRASHESALKALMGLSREERIFAIFGAMSAAWTAYAIVMGLDFWKYQLSQIATSLLARGGDVVLIVLGLVALAAGAPFVLSMAASLLALARRGLGWASARGLFKSTWNTTALLVLVSMALYLLPTYLGFAALQPVLSLVALVAAAFLSWRNAVDSAGSRLARVFACLGIVPVALILRMATTWSATAFGWRWPTSLPLGMLLDGVAYAAALAAALLLFSDTNLRDLPVFQKLLLLLGLGASFATVWLLARDVVVQPLQISGALFPLLALTLLIPTLSAFARTGVAPVWTLLALSLLSWLAAWYAGWPLPVAYILLAVSLLQWRLGGARVEFEGDQPQAEGQLSDQRRLQRAFTWTASGILGQFRGSEGDRNLRVLEDQFNSYAAAAGWKLHLARGRPGEALPEGASLIDRGGSYVAALNLLLDLVSREMGEKRTVRSLQRVYDRLPWEEREIGAEYMYRDMKRAAALSQQFRTTRQDYRSLLQRMPLFATMDDADLDLLCSRLHTERFPAGKTIIRQGDKGDRFYIVRQGHVEVEVRSQSGVTETVNQLRRGDYFGELALLHDAPRNATCRATLPTEVLSLRRRDFDELVRTRFHLREKVDRSIARADLLRRTPVFSELEAQHIQLIASRLRAKAFETGAVLMQQGEIGRSFFVIESGRVQVSVSQNGEETVVAERGPGEYVGEIALLLEVPRTATVTALEPTRTLTLSKADFDRLVATHLYVSRGLERETSRRMLDLRRAVSAT